MTFPKSVKAALLAVLLATLVYADDDNANVVPGSQSETSLNQGSVQWNSLARQSMFFLGVEHGFRLATDPETRATAGGSFFGNYFNAIGNLHGWGDGDPFVVNYIGHPIQGAVAGYIWTHNDLRYRTAEFGRDRRYWTGKLRAMTFAFVYSEEFEIGPVSEASIGHVQAHYPQHGFVDQVITPTVGAGWMVAEDAIDRYVIRKIEAHVENRWVRLAARGFLNPARSFANVMEFEAPWHREGRPGITQSYLTAEPRVRTTTAEYGNEPRRVPAFEFTTNFTDTVLGVGGQNLHCAGGMATGIVNVSPALGIEAEAGGCRMLGPGLNLSGDSTTFSLGPRFSYRTGGRFTPWAHVLFGGQKLTEELLLPEVKAAATASAAPGTPMWTLHDSYTCQYEATGFSVNVGSGVDWMLNRDVAFRVGSIEYQHSWLPRLNDQSLNNDLRVTVGFTLRTGS